MFKLKKKEKTIKKKESNISLFAILLSAILGILLYILSKEKMIFALSMIIGLTISILYNDSTVKNDYKQRKNEIEFYLNFADDFYLYSSLLSSYKDGFKKSVESLPSSHLKDDLTDYLENGNELPFSLTNTRRENHLKDVIERFYYSNEEVSDQDLSYLKLSIESYKKETSIKEKVLPLETCISVILITIFLILMLCF